MPTCYTDGVMHVLIPIRCFEEPSYCYSIYANDVYVTNFDATICVNSSKHLVYKCNEH